MMNEELLNSLQYIEKEKGIKKEVLFDALRSALLSACRKTFDKDREVDVQIDPLTAQIHVFEDGKEVNDPDFGRIAAQTAKQVIMQKIREAERETVYTEFTKKSDDIATGTVHWIDRKRIIVDLGRTEGILPSREQSPYDDFRQGDTIRAYVVEVKKTDRGPEVILSRAHANFVKKLFELEVPEIREGIIQVKAIAREAGSRTKIAVLSTDSKVDCVGSCVGMRGQRVKNIVREIGGEKIDIVRWNEDTEQFIRNSLSPAELNEIRLNREKKAADIFVVDDQLSLAIGKKGQNVRLASKLTGWSLDIKSTSQKIPIQSLKGVGAKTVDVLKQAGITSIKDILKTTAEDLAKLEGIGPKTAEKIIQSAHEAILGGSSEVRPSRGILGEMPATSSEENPQEDEEARENVDTKEKGKSEPTEEDSEESKADEENESKSEVTSDDSDEEDENAKES